MAGIVVRLLTQRRKDAEAQRGKDRKQKSSTTDGTDGYYRGVVRAVPPVQRNFEGTESVVLLGLISVFSPWRRRSKRTWPSRFTIRFQVAGSAGWAGGRVSGLGTMGRIGRVGRAGIVDGVDGVDGWDGMVRMRGKKWLGFGGVHGGPSGRGLSRRALALPTQG